MEREPRTLQEAILYFADPDNCLGYMVRRRWPDGVVCPTCGSGRVGFVASRRLWQCKTRHPKAQFSVKVGTIFEDSPVGLDKWMAAVWMITNCKNGVSSYEIHRALGVTQKTAWFMLHRVRLALQDERGGKLDGEIEIDESFIGGKVRNMHRKRARRLAAKTGRGESGKTVVMGVLERKGAVRGFIVPDTKRRTLRPHIDENVEKGATVYTDDFSAYMDLGKEFAHKVINHAEKYVDGRVHTNGLENFWSLLKRGLHGTYVSVEPFHLFRYLDEQMFRFNNRKGMGDAGRFSLAISRIFGKRLTYAEVTGKVGETSPA